MNADQAAERSEDASEGASAYKVWALDCPCGTFIAYGEDDTFPRACEDCGTPIADDLGDCANYRVWKLDCPCGQAITYNEDFCPDACEDCGTPVTQWSDY